MQAHELAQYALDYGKHLSKLSRDMSVEVEFWPAVGMFSDVYQKEILARSGVYLLHFPDTETFYIGKSDNFRRRIWDHTGIPKLAPDGTRAFVDFRFLNRVPTDRQKAILLGKFCISYLSVRPERLADGLEVHLQTMSYVVDGSLPFGIMQFG